MGEPVTYLTEESYRPDWLKDGVTEASLKAVLGAKVEIQRLGRELAKAERFYLVGSGGSYSVQFPVRYLAEKYTDVPVLQYSGWEFLERMPWAANEGSACLFITQSGKTKEVVRAMEWAKKNGAFTMGLSQKQDSVVNKAGDLGFGTGARGVTMGKLTTLYLLFGTVLKEKGFEVGGRMIKAAESLPSMLLPMIPKAKEFAKKTGIKFKDDGEMYVLGGGINWGLAYQYAICMLQEMCWVHATPINYSEFRHGPVEMFAPGTPAIFLRSRGNEGELEKAVVNWSTQNGVRGIVLDSQGGEVDNLLTPFTLFVELEWLSYYMSLAKNRDMAQWRYYDKVEW
jgi:fructoselysine-6-P-deglycase FrlB-like protein